MFLRNFRRFQLFRERDRFTTTSNGFLFWNERDIDLGGNDPGQPSTPTIQPPAVSLTTAAPVGAGDFLTNSELLAYIREQRLFFHVTGMRPGTTVHAFFDNSSVDANVMPARRVGTGTLTRASFEISGVNGDPLVVEDDGTLSGAFNVPRATFFAGDRELRLIDVSDLASASSATTDASVLFHAFNFINAPSAPAPSPTPPVPTQTTRATTRRTTTLEDGRSGRRDPLSQTFYVGSDIARTDEGVFATKLDLFFENKSDELGVTVELREVENGFPSEKVLPFSRCHKTSAEVNVSSTAATATTFEFDSPIYLRSGAEYAFAIIPDGSNPDYRLWTAEVGSSDVLSSATPVVENWGEGTLFFSTNGTAWTPVQGEDLKFKLYRANFTSETGSVVLVNKDYEFFTTGTANGTFEQGELLFSNTAIAQASESINWDATSANVIGTSTSFDTEFAINDFIVAQGNTVQGFDILQVKSITNSTHMALKGNPAYSNTTADYFIPTNVRVGKVDHWSSADNELFIVDSTASGVNLFVATDVVKSVSGGEATVTTVDDLSISRYQPFIQRHVMNGTALNFTRDGLTRGASVINQITAPVVLAEDNHISDRDIVVRSRSNEAANGKSFKLNCAFASSKESDGTTVRNTISPSINIQGTGIRGFTNQINDDNTDENGLNGAALSKYVSKRINLAEELDSEDIKILLTAYRPSNSEVEVYAKIKHITDEGDFEAKDWSKLVYLGGEDVFSDNKNLNDFREYEFGFASKPDVTAMSGSVTTTSGSPTVNGEGTLFQSELVVGDYVAITDDGGSGDYQVARVGVITSEILMTLDDNVTFTNSVGATIEKVTFPNAAYLNPQNTDIVRYTDANGADFDGYKTFALKIVLRSTTTHNVPKVKDVRAIALAV